MTNNQIKTIVESEAKTMRKDITKIVFTRHSTGFCVAIYADMGLDHNGNLLPNSRVGKEQEWALLTTKMIHRIMSADNILSMLRADDRLYN